jgi:hypothetical protein
MIRSVATTLGISFALSLIMAFGATADDGVTAAADTGTVVFYRPNAFKGKAIRFNINHAGKPVGQLLSGTKIELQVPEGEEGRMVKPTVVCTTHSDRERPTDPAHVRNVRETGYCDGLTIA